MINTSIKIKKQLLPVAIKKLEEQMSQGATKYSFNDDKEWTDIMSEIFGLDYFFMNVMKYMGRIRRNDPRAETDHFKIISYVLLRWMKEYGENNPSRKFQT